MIPDCLSLFRKMNRMNSVKLLKGYINYSYMVCLEIPSTVCSSYLNSGDVHFLHNLPSCVLCSKFVCVPFSPTCYVLFSFYVQVTLQWYLFLHNLLYFFSGTGRKSGLVWNIYTLHSSNGHFVAQTHSYWQQWGQSLSNALLWLKVNIK